MINFYYNAQNNTYDDVSRRILNNETIISHYPSELIEYVFKTCQQLGLLKNDITSDVNYTNYTLTISELPPQILPNNDSTYFSPDYDVYGTTIGAIVYYYINTYRQTSKTNINIVYNGTIAFNMISYNISYETFTTHSKVFLNYLFHLLDLDTQIGGDLEPLVTDNDVSRSIVTSGALSFDTYSDQLEDMKMSTSPMITYSPYPPESNHPAAVAIGDTNIWFLPLSIAIREFNSTMPIPVISTDGDAVATNGQRSQQIEIISLFTQEEVNTKLRSIIAQFIRTPLLPVECDFIKSIINPNVDAIVNIPKFKVFVTDGEKLNENEKLLAAAAFYGTQNDNSDVDQANMVVLANNFKDYIRPSDVQFTQSTLSELYEKGIDLYDSETYTNAATLSDAAKVELDAFVKQQLDLGTISYDTYKQEYIEQQRITNAKEILDYKKEYSTIEYSRYGISTEDKQVICALKTLNITSVPGYPHNYRVELIMEITNSDIYGGVFKYLQTQEDVGKAALLKLVPNEKLQKILNIHTTTDCGKSEPYISYYKQYIEDNLEPIGFTYGHSGANFNNENITLTYSYSDDIITDVLYKNLKLLIQKVETIRVLARSVVKLHGDDETSSIFTIDTSFLSSFSRWMNDVVFFTKVFMNAIGNPSEYVSKYLEIAGNGDIKFYIGNTKAPGGSTGIGFLDKGTDQKLKQDEYIDTYIKYQNVASSLATLTPQEAWESYNKTWDAGFLTSLDMFIQLTRGSASQDQFSTLLDRFSDLFYEIQDRLLINYKENVVIISSNKLITYSQVIHSRTETNNGKVTVIGQPEEIAGSRMEYPCVPITFAMSVSNKLIPLPILGYINPLHQYLGRSSWNGNLNIQSTHPDVKRVFARLQERTRYLLTYKQMIDLRPEDKLKHISIDVSGGPFMFTGINQILISDVDYRTVENHPGLYNINLGFMETTLKRKTTDFEEIQDGTENYADRGTYQAFFDIMKEITFGNVSAYVNELTFVVQKLDIRGKILIKTHPISGTKFVDLLSKHIDTTCKTLMQISDSNPMSILNDSITSTYRILLDNFARILVEENMQIDKTTTFELSDLFYNTYAQYNNNKSFNTNYYQFSNGLSDYAMNQWSEFDSIHISGNIPILVIYYLEKIKKYIEKLQYTVINTNGSFLDFSYTISKTDAVLPHLVNIDSTYATTQRIKESYYYSFLRSKFAKATIDGVFDLYTNDKYADILELAMRTFKQTHANILLPVEILWAAISGIKVGAVDRFTTALDKALRLLELQSMCKLVLNDPYIWYSFRQDVINEFNIEQDANTRKALIALLSLLEKVETQRFLNGQSITLMYNKSELPTYPTRPGFLQAYHPTFYLFNVDDTILEDQSLEFYDIMRKQAVLMRKYYADNVRTILSNIKDNITTSVNDGQTKIAEIENIKDANIDLDTLSQDSLSNAVLSRMYIDVKEKKSTPSTSNAAASLVKKQTYTRVPILGAAMGFRALESQRAISNNILTPAIVEASATVENPIEYTTVVLGIEVTAKRGSYSDIAEITDRNITVTAQKENVLWLFPSDNTDIVNLLSINNALSNSLVMDKTSSLISSINAFSNCTFAPMVVDNATIGVIDIDSWDLSFREKAAIRQLLDNMREERICSNMVPALYYVEAEFAIGADAFSQNLMRLSYSGEHSDSILQKMTAYYDSNIKPNIPTKLKKKQKAIVVGYILDSKVRKEVEKVDVTYNIDVFNVNDTELKAQSLTSSFNNSILSPRISNIIGPWSEKTENSIYEQQLSQNIRPSYQVDPQGPFNVEQNIEAFPYNYGTQLADAPIEDTWGSSIVNRSVAGSTSSSRSSISGYDYITATQSISGNEAQIIGKEDLEIKKAYIDILNTVIEMPDDVLYSQATNDALNIPNNDNPRYITEDEKAISDSTYTYNKIQEIQETATSYYKWLSSSPDLLVMNESRFKQHLDLDHISTTIADAIDVKAQDKKVYTANLTRLLYGSSILVDVFAKYRDYDPVAKRIKEAETNKLKLVVTSVARKATTDTYGVHSSLRGIDFQIGLYNNKDALIKILDANDPVYGQDYIDFYRAFSNEVNKYITNKSNTIFAFAHTDKTKYPNEDAGWHIHMQVDSGEILLNTDYDPSIVGPYSGMPLPVVDATHPVQKKPLLTNAARVVGSLLHAGVTIGDSLLKVIAKTTAIFLQYTSQKSTETYNKARKDINKESATSVVKNVIADTKEALNTAKKLIIEYNYVAPQQPAGTSSPTYDFNQTQLLNRKYTFDMSIMQLIDNSSTSAQYMNISSIFDLSKITMNRADIISDFFTAICSQDTVKLTTTATSNGYKIYVTINNESFSIPDSFIIEQDRIKNNATLNDYMSKSPAEGYVDAYMLFNQKDMANEMVSTFDHGDDIDLNKVRTDLWYIKNYAELFSQTLSSLIMGQQTQQKLSSILVNNNNKAITEDQLIQIIDAMEAEEQHNYTNIIDVSEAVETLSNVTDTFSSYFNTPIHGIEDVMQDIEQDNYRQSFEQYHYMRPRFKVLFREDDMSEFLMLSDAYAFDDIVEIQISAEKSAATRTAKIVLSNVLGRLTDINATKREISALADLQGEQLLKTLDIQPGTTIIIVGGYDGYSYNNPVFIGKIVELYPGPQMTIVAQSFGAELLHVPYQNEPTKLDPANNYGDLGDFSKNVLDRVPAVHFGNMGLKGFTQTPSIPLDAYSDETLLKTLLFNETPFSFDNDRDVNIMYPKSHFLRRNASSGFQRGWWITPDQTTWDCLSEMALYRTDYIATTKVFNAHNYSTLRETAYLGPKHGYYIHNDLELYKLNLLVQSMREELKVNLHYTNISEFENFKETQAGLFPQLGRFFHGLTNSGRTFLNTDYFRFDRHHDSFSRENSQIIIDEIIGKMSILSANDPYADKTNYIVANKDVDLAMATNINNSIAEIGKRIANSDYNMATRVRKTHFITSGCNLISNNIITNINFNNKVTLEFPREGITWNYDQIKKTSGIFTTMKNILLGSGSGIETQAFTMDDNIKPENIREYITFQKNIDSSRCEVGAQKLRYVLKREIDNFIMNDANITTQDQVEQAKLKLKTLAKQIPGLKQNIGITSGNAVNIPDIYGSKAAIKGTTIKSKIAELIMLGTGVTAGSIALASTGLGTSAIPALWIGGGITAISILLKGKNATNQYIQTANGPINATDYYKLLTEKYSLSDAEAVALLNVSAVRPPQYITVGRNILAQQATGMYDGSVTILGNLEIEPYDRCVLYDLVNNMQGIFEVRNVVHNYSATSGFTTTITPDLLTYVNEKRDIFDAEYLIQKATIRNKGQYLAGATITASAIGTGIGLAMAGGPGAIIGLVSVGAIAYFTAKDYLNKLMVKEAGTILGRHAIGFMPLIKAGKPFVGGIGGYNRTPYKVYDYNNLMVSGAIYDKGATG